MASAQLTDQAIGKVVSEVLAELRRTPGARTNGHAPMLAATGKPGRFGVFEKVSDAVAAAVSAQKAFERKGTEARSRAVACIRKICIEQARPLGEEEFHETRIGRLDHKIEKLVVAGERTPGVEFLRTHAMSGGNGLTLTEYAPFGVIGVITPVTHSLPTLAGNAINMLAAGNALVCNPHPSGARIACHGVELFNRAIHQDTGIDNLITIIAKPTLESAQEIFDSREIRLLCVTGGPAVGRAALASKKRAVVAGPGNPPVVVDETADLDNAARSIIKGGAYDNNLLCIGEKEVFAVQDIFDELLQAMERAGAVRLDEKQVEQLTKAAFVSAPDDKTHLVVNKDLLGKDPAEMAERAGFRLPRKTELLFAETDESNPFVPEEQMMPFVPFVRVPNVDRAIELALKHEHGFKHTALIHSRNLATITEMGRVMDVSIFVVNGPSMAGLGVGGEGYLSYSIATPTGEGVTTPLTFTRQRRVATIGGMRIL
jgi:acyl-CoA reductase-like NAD-dependent aldehyde dehydrogenase